MSAPATATGSAPSLSARIFGPVTDRQSYLNVLYLLLRFPLGITYFTVFLTGIALGVSLLILVVGVPILAFTLGLATYAAHFEARLTRRLLGIDVRYEPPDPTAEPLVAYLKAVLTEPQHYILLGYFFATFGIGVASFVVVTVLFAFAGALAVAPLTYWLPWVQFQITPTATDAVGRIVIDTLPEALVASVVGVGLFVASLHVCTGLAALFGRVTQVVLS